MDRRIILTMATLLVWSQVGAGFASLPAAGSVNRVRMHLHNRLEDVETSQTLGVAGEPIQASVLLPRFYARRQYQPAWSGTAGPLPHVERFLTVLSEAEHEGLRPPDYHLGAIATTLAEVRHAQHQQQAFDPARLADLDLLLSDAFLTYGLHLLVGHSYPQAIDAAWFAAHPKADIAHLLQQTLETNHLPEALRGLAPPQPGYAALRQALAHYRQIAARGGWPTIADGPTLRQGDQSERVAALRMRLQTTGELEVEDVGEADLFDEALERAVRTFQQRHGLTVDGVVGPATRAALSVPVEARVQQIAVNLDRWRWLPQDLGSRHLLVNIANFTLDVVEAERSVMTMRVVVGKPYHRTPVFNDTMTYLVLNPYWHVPASIARQEIIPQVRRDPGYLAKHNLKVVQGWGTQAEEVHPQTIDWSTMTAQHFRYRFRQEPGASNALGRVKFMFPNQFNVYLHDTPARSLFAKSRRAFSHGCVRLEKPVELATYVLRDDPHWSRNRLLAAMTSGVRRAVRLPAPLPIHLVYRTAWVETDGAVHFRTDLYGHDTPSGFCGSTSCG